jgi:cytidine deaminase
MKKLTFHTDYELYHSGDEIPEGVVDLVKAAADASLNAYAPYSGFRVGAAVMLENGIVVTGNNQENAAYPSGLCAERVALFAANAHYPDVKVKLLAVYAGGKSGVSELPAMPCGACRQVMVESESHSGEPIPVITSGPGGTIMIFPSAEALLPFAFKPEHLRL